MAEPAEEKRLARLLAQAEVEMRRWLPDDRPNKRHKGGAAGGGGAEAAAGAAGGGRFDYGAIAQLATGLTGFLVTCPLQRENSARKEAVPLLQRYLQQCGVAAASEPPVVVDGAAQEAPAAAAAAAEAAAEAAAAVDPAAEEAAAPAEAAGAAAAEGSTAPAALQPRLAAIKLACRGVVAFKLSATSIPGSADAEDGSGSSSGADSGGAGAAAELVQQAAAALLADIDAGRQSRLVHVQRIIPMQTTCRLERGALEAAGAQLAALVASSVPGEGTEGQPRKVTFGIALKQRMLEVAGGKPVAARASAGGGGSSKGTTAAGSAGGEAAAEGVSAAVAAPAGAGATAATPAGAEAAEAPGGSVPAGEVETGAPLNRGGIIATLAAGFESALRQRHACEAAVDLKAPQWVLVAEVFPASGCLYVALCALPAALCVFKPKLHIKPVGKGPA